MAVVSSSFLRHPAVAAIAVVGVLAAGGTAAANDRLPIFQAERVAPVELSTADLLAIPELAAYGDVVVEGRPGLHRVADPAAAAAETGLDLPSVTTLPGGVRGERVIEVGGPVHATFTFDMERVARAAAADGQVLSPEPPGLDGTQVHLDGGPGVAQVWSSASGRPSLVVARAVAPTLSTTGLPVDVVRDHLLLLPGLPPEVTARLRALPADPSTLLLPVLVDRVDTSTVTVDGVPARLLTTRDGAMAGVVWVQDGVVTVVTGALDADEVLSVARGLG